MIEFNGFGHVNIVVDDLESATTFYQSLFGARPDQDFPHFKNRGFALAAGFHEDPDAVDVSIRFLEIPGADLFLELMEYHSPVSDTSIAKHRTNDLGGPRHLCLRVRDIDVAFEHVTKTAGIELISASADYRPQRIDAITPRDFSFFDSQQESDAAAKAEVCRIVGGIRFFYAIDRYGLQWEFEEGHDGVGGS